MTNCGRQPDPERINVRMNRVVMIGGVAIFHLCLVVSATFALFDGPMLISDRLAFALGLLALGSAAAFFTACINAMDRVPHHMYRPWTRRTVMCVYAASQVEALFRMLVGVSVAGGAYFLTRLTAGC